MDSRLWAMKDQLTDHVEEQINNLQCADYHELGAAMDMIKDLSETIYYCTITEAMKSKEEEEEEVILTNIDKGGKSPIKRKRYIEAKEAHAEEAHRIKELESYMQELTFDIAEMIKDASLSEKQLLQKKISSLATKIEQLNA